MKHRTSLPIIVNLKPHEIFVFGSNLAGIHGAGAARTALNWGAEMGKGIGRYGQTYAIPTKDQGIKTLSIEDIKPHIDKFIIYAKKRTNSTFLVTEIGCGLAGYSPIDIAPLFQEAVKYSNIYLPQSFWNILTQQ